MLLVATVHCAGLLFCLFTAIVAFVRPMAFADKLGMAATGPDGRNEIRAQYGGFFLAVGVLQGAAVGGLVSHGTALTVLVVVFGGLISGRLISLALDRVFWRYRPEIRSLFAVDTIGLVASVSALVILGR